MNIPLYTFFTSIFLINSLIQFILFFYKKKSVHLWIALWLYNNGSNGIIYYFYQNNIFPVENLLVFFDIQNGFLWITQYFMIVSAVDPEFRLKPGYMLFMLPSFAIVIRYIYLIYFAADSKDFFSQYIELVKKYDSMIASSNVTGEILTALLIITSVGFFIYYLVFVIYWHPIRNKSAAKGLNQNIIAIMVILATLDIIACFIFINIKSSYIYTMATVFFGTKCLVIAFFVQIFEVVTRYSNSQTLDSPVTDKKLVNTPELDLPWNPLANVNYNHLEEVFTQLLDNEQVYRDMELTIQKFAALTGYHYLVVSNYLNKVKKIRFTELIADYRVKKACDLLRNEKGFNVAMICYEAGFNSMSNFYRIFKNKTGQTPEEYRLGLK